MDANNFIENIQFRFIKPFSSLKWFNRFKHRLAKIGINIEILNTILPLDRIEARPHLKSLTKTVPKMSTFANAAIIDKFVSLMPSGTSFVNVGVWHGFSFLAGIAANPERKCVAVDNFSQFGGPKTEFLARFNKIKSPLHTFHEMDYEEYFATKHDGPIGFYIYDGEHSYQNQMRGLEVAEPFFAEGCVIMVDDTNDPEPRKATLDFIARNPKKYRLLFDFLTVSNGHPTFWNGVMTFERIQSKK